jgi:hypothetical protein
MFRKIISAVTLLCFALFTGGCYTHCDIGKEQLPKYSGYQIDKVEMTDGEVIEFENKKGKQAALKEDEIVGSTKDVTFRILPLSQVKLIYLSKYDKRKTNTYIIGTAIAAVALVAIFATDLPEKIGFGGGGDCFG